MQQTDHKSRQSLLFMNACVLLAAIFFGAATPATHVVVRDVPPLALAVFRYGFGAILLLAFVSLFAPRLLRISIRDLPFLLLLGGLLFVVFPLTFNIGLSLTTTARGALMLATFPLWSAILGRITGGEHLRPRQVFGIILTALGVGIVLARFGLNWEAGLKTLAGDGLMLVTAFVGALYGVLSKRLVTRYSPLTVTTYAMVLGAALLLLPTAALTDLGQAAHALQGRVLLLVAFLASFAGAIGWFLWTYGLSRLAPTQVAVYVNVNPLVATLIAVWFLGERLAPMFVVGFVTTIIGVLCVNLAGPQGKPIRERPAEDDESLDRADAPIT